MLGNLDLQKQKTDNLKKRKKHQSKDNDDEGLEPRKKRQKGKDLSKKFFKIGNSPDTVMIMNSAHYLDASEHFKSSEIGNFNMAEGEKSFQSMSMSNCSSSSGVSTYCDGGVPSMAIGEQSMTTFFRARSSPIEYKKVERPKILQTDDFEHFVTTYSKYYVDKTLWIKEVYENKDRIQIYTKPRDMGKSINLSMLSKFLDIDFSKYKSSELFGRCTLKQKQFQFCTTHQNKYPVLYINLPKDKLKNCRDQDHLMDELKKYFQTTFDSDLTEVDQIIDEQIRQLNQKHRQKVWVLIDNFDYPMMRALKQQFSDSSELREFYTKLLPKSWLYNELITKIVITGRYLFEIPETILKNSDSQSLVQIMNQPSSLYFGISESEHQLLFNQRFKLDSKFTQKSKDFNFGFMYNNENLACTGSVVGYLYDLDKGKIKHPQTYQFNSVKTFDQFFELIDLDEGELLNFFVDILDSKTKFDYYSRLQLDQFHHNRAMLLNLFVQSGYLTPIPNSDNLQATNGEAKCLMYKVYLRLLNLTQLTSHKILQYFRRGEFKLHTKNYNMDFTESRLHHVETRREAYKYLVYAMFLADNLGHVRLIPFSIDKNYPQAAIIVDEETGRGWVLAIICERIRAQMRRQNLYVLDIMKKQNFMTMDASLKVVKRQYNVSFAFFGKENLIYCIEKKDFHLEDKKRTPANDIVLKL